MRTPDKNDQPNNAGGRHQHPLPQEMKSDAERAAENAHEQADRDIAQDPDLSIHSPNDDLDEGETSRLGEDVNI